MKVLGYLKASQVPINKKKTKSKSKNECNQQDFQSLSVKEAQRAVLMCPHQPQSWAVLIAAMKPSKMVNANFFLIYNTFIISWVKNSGIKTGR